MKLTVICNFYRQRADREGSHQRHFHLKIKGLTTRPQIYTPRIHIFNRRSNLKNVKNASYLWYHFNNYSINIKYLHRTLNGTTGVFCQNMLKNIPRKHGRVRFFYGSCHSADNAVSLTQLFHKKKKKLLLESRLPNIPVSNLTRLLQVSW